MPFDYLMYRERCIEFLAEKLKMGTLFLFLGAGCSARAGLPNWLDLINRMREDVGLSAIDSDSNPSAEDLQRAADEVKERLGGDEGRYRQAVKGCLYRDVQELPAATILHDDLLGAVGAMVMGSKRGSVHRVITTNFDSVLERFVSLYGFSTRPVYRQPELEGAEDVRIYHPHGFLSHPDIKLPDSDFLIFDLESVNEMLGTQGHPWFELTRHLLRSGVGLFIGMSVNSLRDRALGPLLTVVKKELSEERPTGVWVLIGEEDQNLAKEFLRSNIVPRFCPTTDDVPDFLLEICQRAGGDDVFVH